MIRGIRLTTAVAVAIALMGAAGASADVRFAAPGGTGAEPCTDSQHPCSLYSAADDHPGSGVGTGDEIVLASGSYSDTAGDLGPGGVLVLPPGVDVHGRFRHARPTIVIEQTHKDPGVTVRDGDLFSWVEVVNSGAPSSVYVEGGVLARAVVQSEVPTPAGQRPFYACRQLDGAVVDTACLSTGIGTHALGNWMDFEGFPLRALPRPAHLSAELRNVTAVARGSKAIGLFYLTQGGYATYGLEAKSVIARGDETDIRVAGVGGGGPGPGSTMTLTIDHSNFESTRTVQDKDGGGVSSIVSSDPDSNQSDPPLFTPDGFHQLSGSPTIDAGSAAVPVDATDVDGEDRAGDGKPDIGADEFPTEDEPPADVEVVSPTAPSVSCDPGDVGVGALPPASTTCKVIVEDISAEPTSPTGAVWFSADGPGVFDGSDGGSYCLLQPQGFDSPSTCEISYTPAEVGTGSVWITAEYAGSEMHDGSWAEVEVSLWGVNACAFSECEEEGVTPPVPPQVRILSKPAKRTRMHLATFEFVSDQPDAVFECKLDGKPFAPCTSPFKRKVKPGKHTFTVRAVSSSGAIEAKPVPIKWTVADLDAKKSSR